MPIPSFLGSPRQFLFAAPSIVLGLWAFKMVGEVSGPAFEPIIAVCGDPAIPPDEFATRTGYHSYEPLVGLGAFKILVCLITQFLLELRETHPAGMITWCGLMLTGLPFGVLATIEAGRAGARGPVRYHRPHGTSVPAAWYLGCGSPPLGPFLYLWGRKRGSFGRSDLTRRFP